MNLPHTPVDRLTRSHTYTRTGGARGWRWAAATSTSWRSRHTTRCHSRAPPHTAWGGALLTWRSRHTTRWNAVEPPVPLLGNSPSRAPPFSVRERSTLRSRVHSSRPSLALTPIPATLRYRRLPRDTNTSLRDDLEAEGPRYVNPWARLFVAARPVCRAYRHIDPTPLPRTSHACLALMRSAGPSLQRASWRELC